MGSAAVYNTIMRIMQVFAGTRHIRRCVVELRQKGIPALEAHMMYRCTVPHAIMLYQKMKNKDNELQLSWEELLTGQIVDADPIEYARLFRVDQLVIKISLGDNERYALAEEFDWQVHKLCYEWRRQMGEGHISRAAEVRTEVVHAMRAYLRPNLRLVCSNP